VGAPGGAPPVGGRLQPPFDFTSPFPHVAFIYRSFLILIVVAITWVSILKHTESRDRTIRVQDLQDCFQRREFAPTQPPAAVQAHFLQTLVRLHEADQIERSLGWWRNKEISLHWYIQEALKSLEASPEENSLIGQALQNAYFELQKHDALALAESREELKRGRLPKCTEGLFAGDPLVIGFLVSPVIVPQVRNHPANFVLQPATVWALQQDVPDPSSLGLVRQFKAAGIVPEAVLKDLTERLAPPPNPAAAKKND